MNNKDGELTEEEYREVIKYGGGMLINIIIGVVAAVAIAVYMGMLKKGVVFLMLLLPLRQYCGINNNIFSTVNVDKKFESYH